MERLRAEGTWRERRASCGRKWVGCETQGRRRRKRREREREREKPEKRGEKK